GQQHVYVAAADQIAEVDPAAGVDDDGAGDDGDAIAGALDVLHHRRDARDADLDAPLGRDLVGHEREAEAIALAELGDDLDAVHAGDDEIAFADVAQLGAARPGAGSGRGRGPAGCDDDGRV